MAYHQLYCPHGLFHNYNFFLKKEEDHEYETNFTWRYLGNSKSSKKTRVFYH